MTRDADAVQQLLDALNEPAIVVRRGIVRNANAAAKQLLGPKIEGADVRLAIRHPQALAQILAGRSGSVEVSGIGELGRPWAIQVREMDRGLLLVRMVDRSAAVAAERIRVDFVANASHELRTPLSTILGYAETLADDAELEPGLRVRFGGVIASEARRMLSIIQDLMSLSRIEADRFAAPREQVDIAEVIGAAVEQVRAASDGARCAIAVDVADGLPLLAGDRGQLLQLLDNLLVNAVRYGCTDKGCLVRVAARLDRGTVRITVADDGIGIAPEHLPRLTERFYRVDAGRSRESGGTGLGLAIAKHIVERHRGSLDIRSKVGEGTQITVILPAARQVGEPSQK